MAYSIVKTRFVLIVLLRVQYLISKVHSYRLWQILIIIHFPVRKMFDKYCPVKQNAVRKTALQANYPKKISVKFKSNKSLVN